MPKMTLATKAVLNVLLKWSPQEMYGRQISITIGLPSGTVQPILARLERAGWLAARHEDLASVENRPPRIYYGLTNEGLAVARGLDEAVRP